VDDLDTELLFLWLQSSLLYTYTYCMIEYTIIYNIVYLPIGTPAYVNLLRWTINSRAPHLSTTIKTFIPDVIVLVYNSVIYPQADFDLIVAIYITLTCIGKDERDEVKGEKSSGKLRFGQSSWLGCHMRGALFYGERVWILLYMHKEKVGM